MLEQFVGLRKKNLLDLLIARTMLASADHVGDQHEYNKNAKDRSDYDRHKLAATIRVTVACNSYSHAIQSMNILDMIWPNT